MHLSPLVSFWAPIVPPWLDLRLELIVKRESTGVAMFLFSNTQERTKLKANINLSNITFSYNFLIWLQWLYVYFVGFLCDEYVLPFLQRFPFMSLLWNFNTQFPNIQRKSALKSWASVRTTHTDKFFLDFLRHRIKDYPMTILMVMDLAT